MRGSRALVRDSARTDNFLNVLEKRAFGIADADDRATIFTAVHAHQSDRTLAVDDTCDVSGFHCRQGAQLAHEGSESIRKGALPAGTGSADLVEAGGQYIRDFRSGLDYAFNLLAQAAERVIRFVCNRILVLAPHTHALGESMSLYRAALRLALLLPLGVAIPLAWRRFRRCELRFQLILSDQRDP
jgi:hypothetical protein